jgi:hypothetical protein
MGKAIELIEYDVVFVHNGWTNIRRDDDKIAKCPTHWLVVKNGKAKAVSQTKQIRIDGLEWK